jgi:hypothetical protein
MQQRHTARILSSFYNAEFAMVIVTSQGVLFGRDIWGRRSLLQGKCCHCGSIQIASVAAAASNIIPNHENHVKWAEIPPGKIHAISFYTKYVTLPSLDMMTMVAPVALPILLPPPIPPSFNHNNCNTAAL